MMINPALFTIVYTGMDHGAFLTKYIVSAVMGLVLLVLAVITALYAGRYNLHMLQLNGYKNKEHITWLKKNITRQWLAFVAAIAGLVCMLVPNIAIFIVAIIVCIFNLLFYRLMKNQKTKKKLVYTARVKRMIATNVVVGVLFLICMALVFAKNVSTGTSEVSGLFVGLTHLAGATLLYAGLQVFMPMLANLINKPIEQGINRYYINDAERLLKEATANGMTIIGVTGSYGKTSVKFYLQTLLQEKFNVLVTPESYNTPMGVVLTVRKQLKPSHEIFVCEMGARHVGDIKEICDFVYPKHGVITSVGPQHLETFFNMDNIKDTKFELADALGAEGKLFVNADNEYIREKLDSLGISSDAKANSKANAKTDSKANVQVAGISMNAQAASSATGTGMGNPSTVPYKVIAYGNNGGYKACDIKVSQLGTDFTVITPDGQKESFQMPLIGEHNVINVLGAISVACEMGMTLRELKIPVRRLQPVKHRMELIERGAVTIIDDAYNSNPVGSKAAVETLGMFDGVRILVTPGMVELGKDEEAYNEKFGEYAAKNCDYIFLIGAKHTEPIKRGILNSGFDANKVKTYEHLEDVLQQAYAIADEGHKYILLENDLPDNYT